MSAKARAGLVIIFLLLSVMLAGCETAKGFAEDTKNFWHEMVKIDGWMRRNIW